MPPTQQALTKKRCKAFLPQIRYNQNISREKLYSEARTTGFRPEILEKVIQLLHLLEAFQYHPFLKGRLALKGGTALNLFHFDVHLLFIRKKLDARKLRLAFVVYGAMNRKDWRTVSIDDINFDAKELENHLLPVLRKGALADAPKKTWAETMVRECWQGFATVLPFSESEFTDFTSQRDVSTSRTSCGT